MELRQRLTIYRGTRRYLAKAVTIGRRHDPLGILIAFKPFRAPGWRYYEDKDANTVVLAGWDHPEFEEFIGGFQDAPVRHLSACVTTQTVSTTVTRDASQSKSYEAYLKSLAPEAILFDSRMATCAAPQQELPS
ncbi:hypothetical protein [Bradyrhizobium sp. USDA 4451]